MGENEVLGGKIGVFLENRGSGPFLDLSSLLVCSMATGGKSGNLGNFLREKWGFSVGKMGSL